MKPPSCSVVAHRLRVRGFRGISEEEAGRIGAWIRFTPMLQAVLFGFSTVTASHEVLLALAGVLLFGALSGRHPFDWIYDGMIRALEQSPKLPATPPRRRAVFALGAAWCLATAALFMWGYPTAGYALGGMMTFSTALLALTHICIPSLVMGWIADKAGPGADASRVS